jgi:hypothetical protein
VLLLGGSLDDSLFQIPGLRQYLDAFAIFVVFVVSQRS